MSDDCNHVKHGGGANMWTMWVRLLLSINNAFFNTDLTVLHNMYISCLQPQPNLTLLAHLEIEAFQYWPWHTESWVLTCGHVSHFKISQLTGYFWDWDVYSSYLRHGTIYGLPTMINHQDNGIALCAVHDISILLHLAWMLILAGLTTLTSTTQITCKLDFRAKWDMLLWVRRDADSGWHGYRVITPHKPLELKGAR